MHVDSRLLWLTGILLMLLLISVIANVHFIKHSRHFFREFNRVRLDPLAMEQIDTSADESLVAASEHRVLFFGDSRAAAWPSPEAPEGFTFINRGVNGHTAVQANLRYSMHVDTLQPDIVIVQVGVNDLRPIPALAANKAQIIANCQENIRQIVDQAKQSGATVILTTIFPLQEPPWENRLYWSDDVLDAVETVNTFIHSLQSERVIILDTFQLLANEQGLLAEVYAEDYMHINESGYQSINQALVQTLQLYPQQTE